MLFREHVPLAPFTTFRIGGPARWFAEAETDADLLDAVEFAQRHALPLFVLGGGSNLLVADAGFPGLVLRIASRGIAEEEDGSHPLLSVAAGEDWDQLVTYAVTRNYVGIECLAGIPGTVGGTPVQNVGAYGQEVSTTIQSVRALDLASRTFVDLDHTQCGFEYRRSIFNTSARGKYIVVSVTYRLQNGAPPTLAYEDLKQFFKKQPYPTLGDVAQAVREIRRRKGMLITPGDPDCLSAGSFFKNPVIPLADLSRVRLEGAEPPHYPAGEGKAKIPAAWLVEHAGFHKGFALGQAGISTRHTLALVNRGNATAADILDLRDRIIAAVLDRFGIVLEPEPVWVG